MTKHCKTPWSLSESGPSGLEISAPVDLQEFVEFTHRTGKPMPVVWKTGPQMAKIAVERWVQFCPQGWDAMQKANFEFIVMAVNSHDNLIALLQEAARLIDDDAFCGRVRQAIGPCPIH